MFLMCNFRRTRLNGLLLEIFPEGIAPLAGELDADSQQSPKRGHGRAQASSFTPSLSPEKGNLGRLELPDDCSEASNSATSPGPTTGPGVLLVLPHPKPRLSERRLPSQRALLDRTMAEAASEAPSRKSTPAMGAGPGGPSQRRMSALGEGMSFRELPNSRELPRNCSSARRGASPRPPRVSGESPEAAGRSAQSSASASPSPGDYSWRPASSGVAGMRGASTPRRSGAGAEALVEAVYTRSETLAAAWLWDTNFSERPQSPALRQCLTYAEMKAKSDLPAAPPSQGGSGGREGAATPEKAFRSRATTPH